MTGEGKVKPSSLMVGSPMLEGEYDCLEDVEIVGVGIGVKDVDLGVEVPDILGT
jgi:hypothetical protein